METTQSPQNGTITTEALPLVEQTFEKHLFPTTLFMFDNKRHEDIKQQLIDAAGKLSSSQDERDVLSLDEEFVSVIKQAIFDICSKLPEVVENEKIPVILGSNIMFQQPREHIPVHAYENSSLVFTFVLNGREYIPSTYFVDPRGAVQTIRQKVSQGLIGTYFYVQAIESEIIVTPGYLQRYVETNLGNEAYVTFNVLVGYTE
jgi:hypothetical protein